MANHRARHRRCHPQHRRDHPGQWHLAPLAAAVVRGRRHRADRVHPHQQQRPTWACTFRAADNQTRVHQVQQSFGLARTAADTAQDAPRFQARALPKPSDN
ncbi:hypothetical protein [Streptomyces sp. NPDC058092]|uniref:hypothetical protein n=1 Tax=Streptomyces sp. NPDC058092 TaxID=3346336 RepID=UPI0036E7C54A